MRPRIDRASCAAVLSWMLACAPTILADGRGGPGPGLTRPPVMVPPSLTDAYGRTTLHGFQGGTIEPLDLPPMPASTVDKTPGTRVAEDPIFQPYQSYPLPYGAAALAVGDVTG